MCLGVSGQGSSHQGSDPSPHCPLPQPQLSASAVLGRELSWTSLPCACAARLAKHLEGAVPRGQDQAVACRPRRASTLPARGRIEPRSGARPTLWAVSGFQRAFSPPREAYGSHSCQTTDTNLWHSWVSRRGQAAPPETKSAVPDICKKLANVLCLTLCIHNHDLHVKKDA